jgi:hypothetical protein
MTGIRQKNLLGNRQEVFYWKSAEVLFLAESIVSALGEGNVHIRPGYGTGDILFLVIQEFPLGFHCPVAVRVRVGASCRIALGDALQGRILIGERQRKGSNAH